MSIAYIALIAKILYKVIIFVLALFMMATGNDRGRDYFKSITGIEPFEYLGISGKPKRILEAFFTVIGVFLLYLTVQSIYQFVYEPTSATQELCNRDSVIVSDIDLDIEDLQKIIRNCRHINPALTDGAKTALTRLKENAAYQGTYTCFDEASKSSLCSTDALNACLAYYVSSSPARSHLVELKERIEQERASARCKLKPQPSSCAQQDYFNKVLSEGVEGLRRFVGECQSEGGEFVGKARGELSKLEEETEYQKAMSCIRSSASSSGCVADTFSGCLDMYYRAFPLGYHLSELRQKVEQERNSSRCHSEPAQLSTRCTTVAVIEKGAERCIVAGSGDSFRDCPNCPEMVVLPAGEFLMGSNDLDDDRNGDRAGNINSWGPVHKVAFAKPFAVGKFEVTFENWKACVKGGGCTSNRNPNDHGFGKGQRPVIEVTWYDAAEYAAWLSRATGQNYRLLSEAEWEYAARAGSTTRYEGSDDINGAIENCGGCGSQWERRQTAPVGSFRPNAYGLFDMHGNVFEWCQDNWHGNYANAPNNGVAWYGGDATMRVMRGGPFLLHRRTLRSAERSYAYPAYRNPALGFRVARAL